MMKKTPTHNSEVDLFIFSNEDLKIDQFLHQTRLSTAAESDSYQLTTHDGGRSNPIFVGSDPG